MRTGIGIRAVMAAVVMGGVCLEVGGDLEQDAYLRGYVQAVMERELGLKGVLVKVEEGVVRWEGRRLSEEQRRRVKESLSDIAGVRAVEWEGREAEERNLASERLENQKAGEALSEKSLEPAEGGNQGGIGGKRTANGPVPEMPSAEVEALAAFQASEKGWFPQSRAMEPVLADPRWPHFSVAWHGYHDAELNNVATVSFGETISFYRGSGPAWLGGQWDFVIQPGVFAFFDLDSESADLQNADYFIGGGIVWRNETWTVLGRIFHQSSHLGDEYILHHGLGPAQRINLSYECAHVLVFFEPDSVWRIYGGGGVLFDEDPPELPPWTVEYGLEFRSPWTLWEGRLRPVAAVDVKHWEYSDWNPDVSVRAGLDLCARSVHQLLLMLEYYNGHSPNGQFFSQTIRYVGIGLHFYY